MKKILLALLFSTSALTAVPQAVVFDWGNVMATKDRSLLESFLSKTFGFTPLEYEAVNAEKRKAVGCGMSDVEFWTNYARHIGFELPLGFAQTFMALLKESVGVDAAMFELVDELKKQSVQVALLSNVSAYYSRVIRNFGYYQAFDPCLLSCEMGYEKPCPAIYAALLQAINLPAQEIVFIDDKVENVSAAKLMGIDAIAFESMAQLRQELSKRGLGQNRQKLEK